MLVVLSVVSFLEHTFFFLNVDVVKLINLFFMAFIFFYKEVSILLRCQKIISLLEKKTPFFFFNVTSLNLVEAIFRKRELES